MVNLTCENLFIEQGVNIYLVDASGAISVHGFAVGVIHSHIYYIREYIFVIVILLIVQHCLFVYLFIDMVLLQKDNLAKAIYVHVFA